MSFVLFAAWQRIFQYPSSSEVIVPALGSLDTSLWAALIHGIGGWLSLSVIVSLEQPGRFLRNLLRPLYAIEDEYIRRIFRSPLTLFLAVTVFVVTFLIAVSNVSLSLKARYEMLACLPSGHGHGELIQEATPADSVRLGREAPARLLLRGWNAREILVFRDRYNLATIDAVEIRRTWLGFSFSHINLQVGGQPVKAQVQDEPVEKTSPFGLSIRGTLSYGRRAVLWAIVADQGIAPGRLLVGEPEDGPEDPPNAHPITSLFFKDLWTSRDLFSRWTSGHQPHFAEYGIAVHHPTSDYNNRILFKEGELPWHDGRRKARTKEAILVISKKADLPPTAEVLTAVAAGMSSDRVVGFSKE